MEESHLYLEHIEAAAGSITHTTERTLNSDPSKRQHAKRLHTRAGHMRCRRGTENDRLGSVRWWWDSLNCFSAKWKMKWRWNSTTTPTDCPGAHGCSDPGLGGDSLRTPSPPGTWGQTHVWLHYEMPSWDSWRSHLPVISGFSSESNPQWVDAFGSHWPHHSHIILFSTSYIMFSSEDFQAEYFVHGDPLCDLRVLRVPLYIFLPISQLCQLPLRCPMRTVE